MTTQEFELLVQQLGLSDEELASKLGVTSRLVQKWREGRVAIGDRFEIVLQSLAFQARATALLATSGLDECSFVKNLGVRYGDSAKLSPRDSQDFIRHVRSCTVCKARDDYVTQHLGSPPGADLPPSMVGRIFGWVGARIELLPEWAQPAASGAVFLFAFVAARSVFIVPVLLLRHAPIEKWLPMASVPFAAALGGAAGGFGYSFIGKPLRRIRVVGRYLAGIVTVAAYMLALNYIFGMMGEPIVTAESDLVIFTVVTIFFGLVIGKTWFKPEDDPIHYDGVPSQRIT